MFNPSYDHSAREVMVQGFSHLRREDPIGYLEAFFSQPLAEPTSHIGFRLFYSHAQAEEQRDIWAHLQDMTGLKVIHLQRKNLLKNLLSLRLAESSSIWMTEKGAPTPTYEPVSLGFDECLLHFQTREAEIKRVTDFFRSSPTVDVFYEDLVTEERAQRDRILGFLGLEPQSLSSKIVKQNRRGLSESIANYLEIKTSFADTTWARFFEE